MPWQHKEYRESPVTELVYALHLPQAAVPGAAGPGAKFPQWTVVVTSSGLPTTSVIGEVTNAITKSLVEASAYPNSVVFFTSHQAALNYVNSHGGHSPNIPGIYNSQNNQNTATGVGQNALNTAGSAVYGIADVGQFFNKLQDPHTWVRVGEFAVGGLVFYAGLKALLSGTPIGNAVGSTVSTAKKAAKTTALIIPK